MTNEEAYFLAKRLWGSNTWVMYDSTYKLPYILYCSFDKKFPGTSYEECFKKAGLDKEVMERLLVIIKLREAELCV